ncbi:MAG TPA: DUF2330 domain-containing protein, partial [Polyangiaceae bacterium]|nr:DUF2330 domain-containing protein [Polyangiaceae bacterium]
GSIRPIALTYEASRPMIPIKLTSVAANENMGVMTWVLADDRAVPQNYNALELNEARINWFNPNPTYNAVVTAAADEASGQGFVTEYAQPASSLANQVWTSFDEEQWSYVEQTDDFYTVEASIEAFGSFDGFWDVFSAHVTLPEGATLQDVQDCYDCYGTYTTVYLDYLAALEKEVIAPARLVQQLLDAHPYVTRLYTTMSADEMTVDPLFTFNPDLGNVSNVHNADRVIECGPGYYFDTAPWRIELPQGGVVRGGPAELGSWPSEFAELPANRRILRQGESGDGRVLEDNAAAIDQAIETYSASVDIPPPLAANGGAPGLYPPGRPNQPTGPGDPDDPSSAADPSDDSYMPGGGCGCRVGAGRLPSGQVLFAAGALLLLARRRRRQA